jgi:hypothetical protein
MPYRSINEIEMELKEVKEIIASKESALLEFPHDFGLELELMEFENILEDLIREMSKVKNEPKMYTKHIKNRLTKTQLALSKKRDEYILNPNVEELEDDIELLELMEKGLWTELERCYLDQNLSVGEIKLTGKMLKDFRMPLRQLGEIFIKFSDVPVAIAKSIYYKKKRDLVKDKSEDVQINLINKKRAEFYSEKKNPEKISSKKEDLSKFLEFNSQVYASAVMSGSVRIILTSPQSVINNESLNDSFKVLKELVDCGNDKEALQKETDKIGDVDPIIKYRNFLQTLKLNKINVEFSGKNKKLENIPILEITHEKAKEIFQVLNAQDKPISYPLKRSGTFRAVDLDERKFKFHLEDENKVILGKYDEELDSVMKDKNFNEPYTVEICSFLPSTNLKKQVTKYKLLKFLN